MTPPTAAIQISDDAVGALVTAAVLGIAYLIRWLIGLTTQQHAARTRPAAVVLAAKSSIEINAILAEARYQFGATRAVLDRFHNGNEFFPDIPMWRLTRTGEATAPGVTPEALNYRNVPADLVPEAVSAVFGTPSRGVRPVVSPAIRDGRIVAVIDVEGLPEGYYRAISLQQGVRFRVVIPITDRRRRPVGLLGLDFNSETCPGPFCGSLSGRDDEAVACLIVLASRIEALLMESKK
jgi:hypothetical protein